MDGNLEVVVAARDQVERKRPSAFVQVAGGRGCKCVVDEPIYTHLSIGCWCRTHGTRVALRVACLIRVIRPPVAGCFRVSGIIAYPLQPLLFAMFSCIFSLHLTNLVIIVVVIIVFITTVLFPLNIVSIIMRSCSNSGCLKGYCECFRAGIKCSDGM